MDFWIIFLCALGLTVAMTPLAIRIAHKTGAIDIPKDNRRVHQRPVPRIGGMAIFVGTTLAMLLAMAMNLLGTSDTEMKIVGIIVGGVFIYLLGTVDDFKNLPALVKLFGQIGCAVVVFAFGNRIDFITNYFGEGTQQLAWTVSLIVTIIWIVAITNTINLVDGLDGLATGIAAIASLCIAYVAYIFGYYPTSFCLLAVAGSSLGFLPFNFYPAKTFMGDGGALFLGFMIANLSILEPVKRATLVAVLIPVLVLALPLFDTLWAIIRRKVNGKPIMQADKDHIHHRLMRTGMGQRRTVLCLYGICGIMGVAAVLMSRELYVECLGLLAVAATFVLVVLTDMNDLRPRIRKGSDS
jgi:UDP-GlcNAc:undecaprenyl-phosphate/decaprenyl-phosphate GlcNAc-1-phosphate transferase